MKTKSIIIVVTLIISFLGCNAQNEKKEAYFPELTGPYFGQKKPGKVPKMFLNQYDIGGQYIFYNNGRECIYNKNYQLYYTKMNRNNTWSIPELLEFNINKSSGKFAANISANEDVLMYNTLDKVRRVPIWTTTILDSEFKTTSLTNNDGMYPSMASNGNLYFTYRHNGVDCIAMKRYVSGNYTEIELVASPVFSEKFHDQHPFIASDESYLIFDSENRIKKNKCALYISFKKNDNTWTEPINMGDYIMQDNAAMAKVSPDGKYLFYSDSNGKEWWVSTQIIKEL